VIKQVIKSRILADCWKKHPKLGTIPIEIYVMSAISNTSYMLPPRRPWSPSRSTRWHLDQKNSQWSGVPPEGVEDDWIEGKIIKGHPNICPLLDFFEDSHYYYLVLPSSTNHLHRLTSLIWLNHSLKACRRRGLGHTLGRSQMLLHFYILMGLVSQMSCQLSSGSVITSSTS
jgi:hypothetical protein